MHEKDPTGRQQHEPGAKLDAGKNRLGLVLLGFSRALQAVGEIGTKGAAKYTDNGWKSVPNGIDRYTDALLRHLLAQEEVDKDSEQLHAAHAAWNALARLELLITGQPGACTQAEGAGILSGGIQACGVGVPGVPPFCGEPPPLFGVWKEFWVVKDPAAGVFVSAEFCPPPWKKVYSVSTEEARTWAEKYL